MKFIKIHKFSKCFEEGAWKHVFLFFFVKNYSITFNNAFKNSFDVNDPMLRNFYCPTIDQTTGLLSMPDSIMSLFFFTYFPLAWCNF